VCGLRRHSYIVSFDFWESGLLDLWVRQLDARADDCEHKESFLIKGELRVEEDLTVDGRVEGRIDLGDHNLWVAPHGEVNAVIHARNVIIAGALVGKITATEDPSRLVSNARGL
jgi:hypothetical protein